MNKPDVFVTINHLDDFQTVYMFKPGDVLTLKKDRNNIYDDEAIAVYDAKGKKCGYVANSAHSVARGTYSAGRVYDKIPDEIRCTVRFATEESLIAAIREEVKEESPECM